MHPLTGAGRPHAHTMPQSCTRASTHHQVERTYLHNTLHTAWLHARTREKGQRPSSSSGGASSASSGDDDSDGNDDSDSSSSNSNSTPHNNTSQHHNTIHTTQMRPARPTSTACTTAQPASSISPLSSPGPLGSHGLPSSLCSLRHGAHWHVSSVACQSISLVPCAQLTCLLAFVSCMS